MEVLKGNKLIAEFMGYVFAGDGKKMHFNICKPGETNYYYGSWLIEDFNEHLQQELKYHSSWQWLMPVCKKWDIFFEGANINKKIYSVYEELSDKLDYAVTLYDIIPTFNQIVENIVWLNQKWFKKNKTNA